MSHFLTPALALVIWTLIMMFVMYKADVYFGRAQAILKRRERIKEKTIEHRRLQYRKAVA